MVRQCLNPASRQFFAAVQVPADIHVRTAGRGKPITTALTAAQRHDAPQAPMLLERVPVAPPGGGRAPTRPARIVGGTGDTARPGRTCLRRRDIWAAIRRRANASRREVSFDCTPYRDRTRIEQTSNRLKQHRATPRATKNWRLPICALLILACILLWPWCCKHALANAGNCPFPFFISVTRPGNAE